MEEALNRVGRGYLVILKEADRDDYPTTFPCTASTMEMLGWVESQGYKIIDHKLIDTHDDSKVIGRIEVTVEPKR